VALVAATLAVSGVSPAAGAAGAASGESRVTVPVTVQVEGTPAGQVDTGSFQEQQQLTLVGPCDGEGSCHITGMLGDLSVDWDPEPTGTGYQATVSPPQDWGPCPAAPLTETFTMDVNRDGDGVTVSGKQDRDPHHEDYTLIPGKTCVYRHVITTFSGSGRSVVEAGGSDEAAAGASASTSDSSGAPVGLIVGGAVALIGAAAVGLAVSRRRGPVVPRPAGSASPAQVRPTHDPGRQTVVPSGPSTSVGVRATTDSHPRITIEMTGGGSVD
jgi:hypothetical protein